jgi:fructose-6-phosphate aldolase 1
VADDMLSVLSDDQLLFMQTVATGFDGIMADARRICSLRPRNMYVKIPVTHEGLRAIKAAKAEGLGVLATAIYSADEAFLAAMNGADYLAPYVNRMENYGDGVGQVEDLLEMLAVNGMGAKVVAASFKNASQVHELVVAGIQAVTVPPDVLRAMVDHPGTGIAVGEFSAAWRAAYGRDTFAAE